MIRSRRALASSLAVVVLAGSGCEDAPSGPSRTDTVPPLAVEPLARERTAGCREAMLGGGSDDGWRRLSADDGAFGFFGTGAGFADAGSRNAYIGTRGRVKLPAIVAGKGRVIVSIAPADRDRAALQYGFTGKRNAKPLHRMAFEPCRDKEVTSWPGVLHVGDRSRPVSVRIAVEGETEPRVLRVGHLTPGERDRVGL